jgi:phosphoribosylformylglycinamidine cyclo-ligase
LPAGRALNIDWEAWPRPPLFDLIKRTGDVPEEDMRKTFNLGIGMVLVAGKNDAGRVVRALKRKKEDPVVMGNVV